MRMTLTIWLLLLTATVFSQDRHADFSYIDRKVRSIQGTNPKMLAKELTASYQSDLEKVRSIFRWITENISYFRMTPPTKRQKKRLAYQLPEPEDTLALQPLMDRVAEKVLKERKAICEGYARLFKSLCDHAGIRAEIITGYARSEPTIVESRFRSNHSWNAVNIEGRWYLLDVTWASGVTLFPTGEFLKYFDDYYFLTPPQKFIRHHYPDDLRWTLLEDLPLMSEFRHTPFKQRSFVKYHIVDYFPSTGVIEAAVGDTIRLALEIDPGERLWEIASDSLWDSIDLTNPHLAYVKPLSPVPGNKFYYQFPVSSANIKWLHVMYNNDAVLRYRLKIKNDLAKESVTISD